MQPALRPFNKNNPLAHTQSYPAGRTVYARKLSLVLVEGARRWHLREPLGAILCDRMSRRWRSLSLLYTKDTRRRPPAPAPTQIVLYDLPLDH
jgi:hypothetical protein